MTTVGSPKRVLLWSMLAVILLAGLAAFTMIRKGFSARDEPSSIETFLARTTRSVAVPANAKEMKNPVRNTAEALADARAHWADHCAICHANNGSGETDIGRNLYPKAPDMREAATQNLSDGELYYTIKNGVRLTGMPAWGEAGEDDQDSWKLVHFIRHLPKLTPEEEEQMKKMNPRSVEQLREELEEQEFLNEGKTGNQAPKSSSHEHH